MSNVEGMYSVFFKKRLSKAKPPFDIIRFDIRYSAVRCSGAVKLKYYFGIDPLYLFFPVGFDGFDNIRGDVVDDDLIALGGGVNAIGLVQLPIGGNTI